VLLDELLIQYYHKIEKKMPPIVIKQSPKLYMATPLECLDPLDIVLCLLVITSLEIHVIMSISDIIQEIILRIIGENNGKNTDSSLWIFTLM